MKGIDVTANTKPFAQEKLHSCLKWLDRVFQGQYLPSLSINYVLISLGSISASLLVLPKRQ